MKISIIGGGNMGGAIARGLTAGTLVKASDITVADPSAETLDGLKRFDDRIVVTHSNAKAAQGADIVVVAVKPWLVDRVLEEIVPELRPERQIVVSIAAGVPFSHLNEGLIKAGSLPALYRVIPNTAIAVGESMTAIAACNATEAQNEQVLALFRELGEAILIEERLMGAATALGSCGTAFALRYLRASVEAGVEMGLYPQQAQAIAAQTVKGAMMLLQRNGSHPEAEIDKVTTPGGITVKGLNELEQAGFTAAVIRGLKACL